MGINQRRDGAKPYEEEEDSEESGEESGEESDEESSNSGEERSGEEDGDQGRTDNRGIRDEEMEQPSTSADMTPVVIKEEPLSDDEGPGLSYQEDPDQFAESYKMLESLRRACEGKETGQSSRGALCDSKSSLSKIDLDGMKQEQIEIIMCGICDDVFDSQSDLDVHQKVSHKTVNDSYSVVVDERERGLSPISQVVEVEDETFDVQNEMGLRQELPHVIDPGIIRDSHSGPFEYGTCRLCKKACGNRRMYLMHLRTKHSEELPYECQVCKARYLDKEDLESYNRKRRGQIESGSKEENTCELCGDKTSYACHTCNMEFDNRPKLIVHHKVHCKGKQCYCHLCEKYFPDTRQTREHLETHYPVPLKAKEKNLSVQEIKSEVGTKGGNQPQEAFHLQRDNLSHEKIHLLSGSQSSSENAVAVESSPEQLPRYHCICCKEEFQSLQTLLHVDHSCVHINGRTKRCPFCSKRVRSRQKFRQHIVSHGITFRKKRHQDQDTNRMMFISQVKSLGQTCRCKWCKKEFGDINKLIDHTRIHVAWGRNCCPVCERWYTNTTYFRQHLRVHGIILSDKERQYKIQHAGPSKEQQRRCTWCDKKFQSSEKLAAHTYLHVARGRNCCPVCGMWFERRKSSLFRTHLLSHGIKTLCDDKRQSCKHSGKGSLATQGLKQGVKPVVDGLTQSGVPKHRCAWCHLGFHDLEKLVNHTHDHINRGINHCPVCHLSFSGVWSFKHHLSVHGIIAPYRKKVFHVPSTSIGLPLPQVDKARVMNLQNSEGQDDAMSHERTPLSSHTQTLADSLNSGTPPCVSTSDQGPWHSDDTTQAILDTVSMAASQVQTSCRLPEHCCQWCGREFDGLEELVAHTRIHIKDGKNQCPVCKKWLSNKSYFKQHLKHHGIIPPFENKSRSIEHIRSTMLISQMGKQRKSSTSIKKSNLSRKSSKHKTSLSIGTSDLKSRNSAHKRKFVQHPSSALSHSQQDEMCLDLRSDAVMHSLQDSLESSTTEKRSTDGTLELSQNHTCNVCKIEFSSAESLSQHHCLPNFKLGIYCPLCPKWLKSKLTLQWHMTLAHPNEDKLLDVDKEFLGPLDVDGEFLCPRGLKEGQLQQQVDTLCCEICSKSFVHQSEYITHKKLHIATSTSEACPASRTSDQVQRKMPPSVDPQTVSENRCDLEIADEEEKLCCVWCQKQFHDANELVDHTNVHFTWGSNCCPVCKKWFTFPYFKQHLKLVHGIITSAKMRQFDVSAATTSPQEMQNRCKWCDENFDSIDSLGLHTRLHIVKGRNRCPFCGMWFATNRKSHFRIHLRKHGIIIPSGAKGWILDDTRDELPVSQIDLKDEEVHCAKGQNDDISCKRLHLAKDTWTMKEKTKAETPHGDGICDEVQQSSDERGRSNSSKSHVPHVLPVGRQQQNQESQHSFEKKRNIQITSNEMSGSQVGQKGMIKQTVGLRNNDNSVLTLYWINGTPILAGSPVAVVTTSCQAQQNLVKERQSSLDTSSEASASQGQKKEVEQQTNQCHIDRMSHSQKSQHLASDTQALTESPKPANQPIRHCIWCMQEFSSLYELNVHQRSHIVKGKNRCPICKKWYCNEYYFKTHLLLHGFEIEKPRKTKSLKKKSKSSQKRKSQIRNPAGVKTSSQLPIHHCIWCTQEFDSLYELNVHHQSHIAKGKNHCPICKKWYCDEYYFRKHLQLHGFDVKKTRKTESSMKKSQSYQIIKKQIIFRQARAPVRGQRHCCSWCTEDFGTLVKLVDHTRVHISKRTNHCPVCKKLFTDRSHFGEHLKIHGIIPPPEKKLWSILDIDSNMTIPQVAHAEVTNENAGCRVVLDERLHTYSCVMPTLMDSPLSGTPSNVWTSDQVQHSKESQCVVDATTGDTK